MPLLKSKLKGKNMINSVSNAPVMTTPAPKVSAPQAPESQSLATASGSSTKASTAAQALMKVVASALDIKA